MGKPLFANPTFSDAADLTASSEVGGMEVGHLQTIQPTDIFRTTGTTEYVVADLLSAKSITLVWLGFTNLTSAATWRIRGATSEANLTGAPGYDSGSLTFWPRNDLDDLGYERFHGFHVLPSVQTFRYWRIDLVDVGNTDGYLQAGRLYIANPWEPSRGKGFQWNPPGILPRSTSAQSMGGQTYLNEKPPRTVASLTIRMTDEDDAFENASVLDRLRRDSRDILIIFDPDNVDRLMDWTIYGVMEQGRGVAAPGYGIWQKQWQIVSLD